MINNPLLKSTLLLIREADALQDHKRRNLGVLDAVGLALRMGLEAGFRLDPKEPNWPVAFIELPTGQISFHLKEHVKEWDGHDTAEKYRRVMAYVEG